MGLYNNYSIDSLRENATYDIWSSDIDTSVLEKYDDIGDMGSEIIVQCEQNWAKLIKTIGLSELADVENGVDTTTVIYEAGGLKGFFAAAKKFFKSLFDKVAALFKAIGLRLFNGCKNAKEFCEKYKKEINNINVPDDFEYQGYVYTRLKDFSYIDKAYVANKLAKIDPEGSVQNDPIIKYFIELDKDSDKRADEEDKIRGTLLNQGTIPDGEWNNELFKYFRNGEDEKTSIEKVNYNTMVKDIMDSGAIKDDIDRGMAAYKKIHSTAEAILTKADKDAAEYLDRDDIKIDDNEKKEITTIRTTYQTAVSLLKFEHTSVISIINAQLKALEDRNNEYKKVLIKLISKTRFNNLKKDESADFGMSHYNSAIENIEFI